MRTGGGVGVTGRLFFGGKDEGSLAGQEDQSSTIEITREITREIIGVITIEILYLILWIFPYYLFLILCNIPICTS